MTDFLPKTCDRPKRLSAWQMVVRWATLLVFSGGTLGLPLNLRVLTETDAATRASAKPLCRCSLLVRKSGACCCQNKSSDIKHSAATIVPSARTCCKTTHQALVSPSTSTASGCCKARPARFAKTAPSPIAVTDHPPQKAKPTNQPTLDVCPCGLSDEALLFVCGEPRVLPSVSESAKSLVVIERLIPTSTSSYGLRLPPDVPPPKWPALCA